MGCSCDRRYLKHLGEKNKNFSVEETLNRQNLLFGTPFITSSSQQFDIYFLVPVRRSNNSRPAQPSPGLLATGTSCPPRAWPRRNWSQRYTVTPWRHESKLVYISVKHAGRHTTIFVTNYNLRKCIRYFCTVKWALGDLAILLLLRRKPWNKLALRTSTHVVSGDRLAIQYEVSQTLFNGSIQSTRHFTRSSPFCKFLLANSMLYIYRLQDTVRPVASGNLSYRMNDSSAFITRGETARNRTATLH